MFVLFPVWFYYIVGPLIGAVVAGLLYRMVHGGSAPTVAPAGQSTHTASTRPHEAFIPPMPAAGDHDKTTHRA